MSLSVSSRLGLLPLALASIALACSDASTPTGADGGGLSAVAAAPTGVDGGGGAADGSADSNRIDSAAPSDAAPTLTCNQRLANPSASGACLPGDEGKVCSQGCLRCTCSAGQWQPCTTDPSCTGG